MSNWTCSKTELLVLTLQNCLPPIPPFLPFLQMIPLCCLSHSERVIMDSSFPGPCASHPPSQYLRPYFQNETHTPPPPYVAPPSRDQPSCCSLCFHWRVTHPASAAAKETLLKHTSDGVTPVFQLGPPLFMELRLEPKHLPKTTKPHLLGSLYLYSFFTCS